MKTRVFLLGAVALTLAACSGGGGGSAPAPRIDPLAKPSNPASDSYVQGALATYSSSSSYLPGDAVLFNDIPDGMFSTKKKYVYDGSSERKTALNKLNYNGVKFADKIKLNCSLTSSGTEQQGSPRQAGDSVYSDITMSASGTRCPYTIDAKNSQKITIIDLKQNPRGGGSVVAAMTLAMKDTRTVNDANIQSASGITSTDINISADINMSGIIGQNGETQSMTITGTVSGNIEIVFANGEKITGPVEGDIAGKSASNMDLSVRFKGTSSQGDIWIAIVTKDGKGAFYINGKKIELQQDGLNLSTSLQSSVSALIDAKL